MSVFLAAYLVSLIVRGEDRLADLQRLVGGRVRGTGSLLCLLRGFTKGNGRAVAVTLGLGLAMWAIGDVVLTFQSRGGVEPPTPSLADVFYLGFFRSRTSRSSFS